MIKVKRKVIIVLLTSFWTTCWIITAVAINAYRDKLLNFVPHSSEYLTNQPTEVPLAVKPNHIVMIGVDGLATYSLDSGYTPNMDYLMHQGAYTLNAIDMLPSSSAANWASTMYATDPVKHGVVDQDLWNFNHTVANQVRAGQVSIFDQLWNGLGKNLPSTSGKWFGFSSETDMFYKWAPAGSTNDSIKDTLIDTNSTYFKTPDDIDTFKSRNQVLDNKPLFSFFYFVNPDLAGHSREWNSEEYNQSISQTDNYIGGIIDTLKTNGMMKDTLVIITSDHGGISQYHGHGAKAETKIPLILYGAGLPAHGVIPDQIRTYDVPATINWLLTNPVITSAPPIWDGQPFLTPFFKMYNMYDRSENL